MYRFFINRPIVAMVIAILMVLIGGICIFILPISLYPEIVPPTIHGLRRPNRERVRSLS